MNFKQYIIEILQLASRAPSAHNSQPWSFFIHNNGVTIYPEARRLLPIGDPEKKEMWISIGCLIEHITQISSLYGLTTQINILSDRVDIEMQGECEPPENYLLTPIKNRHTSREKYADKLPNEGILAWIKKLSSSDVRIDIITDSSLKSQLADIALEADIEAMHSRPFRQELASYLRPIGSNFDVGIPVPGIIAFLSKYVNLAKLSKGHNAEIYKKHTPVFFILSTVSNDYKSWIKTGQLYDKIALAAIKDNIVTGPISAPIIDPKYSQMIKDLVSIDTYPQFFCRLGAETKNSPYTPRLSIEKLVLK